MESIIFCIADIADSHAMAHMRQVSLMSACFEHSSMHALHMAMHACIIGIMVSMVIAIGRIIIFIMV